MWNMKVWFEVKLNYVFNTDITNIAYLLFPPKFRDFWKLFKPNTPFVKSVFTFSHALISSSDYKRKFADFHWFLRNNKLPILMTSLDQFVMWRLWSGLFINVLHGMHAFTISSLQHMNLLIVPIFWKWHRHGATIHVPIARFFFRLGTTESSKWCCITWASCFCYCDVITWKRPMFAQVEQPIIWRIMEFIYIFFCLSGKDPVKI